MNINRFIGHIDQMARQNRFEVDIFCPAIQLRMRSIRCNKAAMPGKTLELSSFNKIPSGAPDHVVKGIKYDDNVVLGFMLDSTFEDRQSIELWQNHIYFDDYSIRYPKAEPEDTNGGYLGTVVIRQLAQDGNSIYEVQLEDAFPTVLSALSFSNEGSAIQTFDVTFTNRTWHSSYENTPSGSILGALFNKHSRRLKSRIRQKVEDKVFRKRARSDQ